jgi:type III secretion protein V
MAGRAAGTTAGGRAAQASADGGRAELPGPLLTPIAVELAPDVAEALMKGSEGEQVITDLVPALRERLFAETGIPLPHVRWRGPIAGLSPRTYVVRLNEVPMGSGTVELGGALVREPVARLAELGFASARAATLPDGAQAAWIAGAELPLAKAHGLPALLPREAIAAHLLELLRRFGYEFVGVQETQALLEALERTHPALVREVVPKLVSPVLLADVLRRLAEEGISLRNLREILAALADWAPHERDPVALTENVRAALRRQITWKHTGPGGALAVYLLDPMIEQTIREAIHKTATGSYLALEPDLSRDILKAVGRTVAASVNDVAGPALITSADIRRYVRRLVEIEYPRLAVLSYQELAPEAKLHPLGRVSVG